MQMSGNFARKSVATKGQFFQSLLEYYTKGQGLSFKYYRVFSLTSLDWIALSTFGGVFN